MTAVKVYDAVGEEVSEINIKDTLKFADGRVSRGKRYWYKGLGCPYAGHRVPGTSEVFYMGPLVVDPNFADKTGIFQVRYQPQFSDFVGTCGAKELSIIENSTEFMMSSVDVLDCVNYDRENAQYYFAVDYRCRRQKYLTDGGSAMQLYVLLRYMVEEDWNFIWDKNAIGDVSPTGLVSDVADLFVSRELKSKLGTAYAALYSLRSASSQKYMEFVDYCREVDQDTWVDLHARPVENAVYLLKSLGVDVDEVMPFKDDYNNYVRAVTEYLIVGRNCGDCCDVGLGDKIRAGYREQFKESMFRPAERFSYTAT